MNKQQFLSELKQLLGDIPAAERDEALGYYEDYFEDAGEENESTVLRDLESPEKIAFMIKAGLKDADKSVGEFTERGFQGYAPDDKDEVANTIPGSDDRGFKKQTAKPLPILLVILLICASPIIVPVLFGIFSTLFGISIAMAAVIFSVAIAGIACIAGGVIVFLTGIASAPTSAPAALFLAGIGLMVSAFGILCTMFGVFLITRLVPMLFKFLVRIVVSLYSKLRYGRERRQEV